MLYYTLVFLLIALVAGALGFFGVAGIANSLGSFRPSVAITVQCHAGNSQPPAALT